MTNILVKPFGFFICLKLRLNPGLQACPESYSLIHGFLIVTIITESHSWQQILFSEPLSKHVAINTYSGRRIWQAVEIFLLPVHFQQLHVYMSPFDEGYIVLEIVTRASYDTHEIEKVA